jgi:hypothetical protein
VNPSNDGTTSTGFVAEIFGWAKKPFNSQGSALNWILFVGLLVIAAWMWNTVLLRLRNDL